MRSRCFVVDLPHVGEFVITDDRTISAVRDRVRLAYGGRATVRLATQRAPTCAACDCRPCSC